MQVKFLSLASSEKEDMIWKLSMFQLKSGTLQFMLNTSIDTLPTPANLRIRNIPSVQTVWEQGNNKPLPQLLQGNAEHKVLHLET